MVLGVGIDMVSLPEFRRFCAGFGNVPRLLLEKDPAVAAQGCGKPAPAFVRRGFTQEEKADALTRADSAQYLAGRFAVKEAVFKAVSSLLPQDGSFDLREIESRDNAAGAPYVVRSGELARYLDAAHAEVLISITNEDGYVAAFALAQDARG